MNGLLSQWPLVARAEQLETLTDLLTRRDRASALIFGGAGVGKTRLAAECRRLAESHGHPTEWIAGSYATQTLPLAAAAAFVPPGVRLTNGDGAGGVAGGFEQVREGLTERYDGRRALVVADDMNRLDAASLALLVYLMTERTIMVVGTVRTGDPVPDLVTALWRDDHAVRLDLTDLGRDDFDTLLHLALGGPVAAGTRFRLWSTSKGNPLYVHELVAGALEHGTLAQHEGVWHLQGRLPHTARLGDLVAERMGHLAPDAEAVLEVLSLCQPLPFERIAELADTATLSMLEGSGRISVSADRREVTLGHPMFGEFLRRRMPSLRARDLYRREAERLESKGELSPVEQLQGAHFRLAADGQADPAVLLEAAQVARLANDFRSVRRLIEAVPDQDREPASRLLLGEALYELGSCGDAERTLAGVDWQAVDDRLLVRTIVTRTNNLVWGLCDSNAALELNAEGRRRIRSQPLIDELSANEAAIHLLSGRVDRALEVLEAPAGNETTTTTIRAAVLVPALAFAGRTSEAVAVAAAFAVTGVDAGITRTQVGTRRWTQVFALTEAGRLADAASLARAGADAAARNQVPKAQIWFSLHQGRIALIDGRIATARRCFAEGAGLAATHRFTGSLGIALAGLAATSAMLGDLSSAREALARRDDLPPFGFAGPEQELGAAWTLALEGEQVAAEERFLEAAAAAATSGHRTAEAWILHDLLRACGRNESERLTALAATTDSALVSARAQHADARRTGDGDRLIEAGERFLSLGARLLAAEAFASAADAYRRAGNQRAAAAVGRRAEAEVGACEGARTPDLILTDTVTPLSERERDIARLAATGLPSKEIAARLSLSVRTVDNYLQRIYAKLGVTSRTELARALKGSS